ncbi:MAG: DUF3592 domain-containing protein [Bacteroidota bacterium]
MSDVYNILIFLFLGTGLLFLASKLIEKKKRLVNNGVEVEGVVFKFDDSSSSFITSSDSGNNSRFPVIRFVTKEGLWITETADTALPSFLLKEGQSVKVVYNPDNPKEFIYKTSIDFSKISYLFVALGIGFLIVGIWFASKYLIK